jgi:hypothetical protein
VAEILTRAAEILTRAAWQEAAPRPTGETLVFYCQLFGWNKRPRATRWVLIRPVKIPRGSAGVKAARAAASGGHRYMKSAAVPARTAAAGQCPGKTQNDRQIDFL